MGIKKTVTAGVLALGMTVAVAGSPASSSTDANTASEKAVVKAERAAVSEQRAMTAAAASETPVADGAKRKCVSAKKASRVHLFMKAKKVKKMLGKPRKRSKSGGLWFQYWNTCTSNLDTDLTVTFKKKGKKKHRDWRAYDISIYWS